MTSRTSTSIGVLASLALHAGFGATLLRFGDTWLSPATESVPAESPLILPIPSEQTPDAPLPDPLKLGIDQGAAQSETWLGFKDPTPHSGPASDRDQAQMVVEPPSVPQQPSAEQTPSPPPSSEAAEQPVSKPEASPPNKPDDNPTPDSKPESHPAPQPDAEKSSAPEPAAQSPAAPPPPVVAGADDSGSVKPEAVPPVEPKLEEPVPTPAELELPEPDRPHPGQPDAIADVEPDPHAKPEQATDLLPEIAPDEEVDPNATSQAASLAALIGPPRPTPADIAEREQREREEIEKLAAVTAQPTNPPAPNPRASHQAVSKPAKPSNTAKRPGEVSDRESDAAAVRSAVNVDPGKPAAAKGLKIDTVRPEWSTTTRLVAAPKNPVVRVRFNRAGKVVDANFVDRYDTGWPDVDGPLLDAIYRWKAEGERLLELPVDDPDAMITVTFRITLRTGP